MIDFSFEKRKNFPFNPIHIRLTVASLVLLAYQYHETYIGHEAANNI
jgi:hypothetical protein